MISPSESPAPPVNDDAPRLPAHAALDWIAATAIAAGVADFVILRAVDPHPFLTSESFLGPVVALTALAVGLTHLAALGGFALLGRLRPGLRAAPAAAGLSIPLIAALLMSDFRGQILPVFASAYAHRLLGAAQSVGSILLLAVLAAGFVARARSGAAAAGPARGRRRIMIAGGGALAVLAAVFGWRAFYETYAPLYISVLALIALPPLLGYGLYRRTREFSADRFHALGRRVLAVVLIAGGFTAALVEMQVSGTPLTGFPFVRAGLGLGTVILLLRQRRTSPAAPLLPLAALALAIPLPFASLPLAGLRGETPPGRQILLLSVDTLRQDALSIYNPDAPPTPELDALLGRDAVFTRAWSSASWTLPAVVSIHSGLSPRAHGTDDFDRRAADGLDTIAEALRGREYATEAIVHNGLLEPERGLDQGFDRYYHLPAHSFHRTLGYRLAQRISPEHFDLKRYGATMFDLAARRLIHHRGEPFFLWLHPLDPHHPYDPPPSLWPADVPKGREYRYTGKEFPHPADEQREMRALYHAEVAELDRFIGRLRRRLEAEGLWENLTIVFTSDHGEEFWEHRRWGHGNPPVEALTRVPLGVKLPGGASPVRMDDVVSTRVVRSLVERLAEKAPATAEEKQAFWSEFRAGLGDPAARVEFMTSIQRPYTHVEAIVFGERPYKYWRDEVTGREALYDLGIDAATGRENRAETETLEAARPELMAEARRLFQRHLEESAELGAGLATETTFNPSDEMFEELKGLGYL